jgi:4-hydroxy-tetrahydrodipicolinate reductase
MSAAEIRVALCGAAGSMGRAVAAAIAAEPGMRLAAAIERPDHPALGTVIEGAALGADLTVTPEAFDVVVDFTAPDAAVSHARQAARARVAFVTGVTGLDAAQTAALRAAASAIPIVHAPNLSPGVAVLGRLAREAGRRLPAEYDIEIVEMHHRRKRDAPSGTALQLAAILEGVRAGLRRVHGRSGATGARGSDEIGIHALRGGEVVGEHRVIFAGPGERLELVHRAESRAAFAGGAIAAVRFVRGRAPGLYGMADVLGE